MIGAASPWGWGAARRRCARSLGCTFSVHELRLAPEFDSIRDDPRYLTLLRKYAKLGT